MKIGVDAQPLLARSAGVTSYTRGILEEVIRQDKNNQYDLMLFHPFFKKLNPIFKKSGNFQYKLEGLLPYKVFYKLHKWGVKIPLDIFFGNHDLYLFPNFVIYPHRAGKSVVIIHDLAFNRVPQYVDSKNVDFLNKFVPVSVRQADHVIATSNFTRKSIIETYGVPEDKVTTVYPGVDLSIFRPSSKIAIGQIREKYGLKKPFILYLGTLEPRKNIPFILGAFSKLKNNEDLDLVLAGKKGWMYEEIFEKVRELGIGGRVIFTGYVPDEDRPMLLSAAEVFVFPSFFEGFGMPVIEAQACGTPVVTSNVAPLPEAGGDSAVYIDPYDSAGLLKSLEELLSSASRRENLVKMGLANVRRFSWVDSARSIIKVINGLGD